MSSESDHDVRQEGAPESSDSELSKSWYFLLGVGGTMDLFIVHGLLRSFLELPDGASPLISSIIVFHIFALTAEPRTINQFAFMAVASVAAGALAMVAKFSVFLVFTPSTPLNIILLGLFALVAYCIAGPTHRRLGIPLKRDTPNSSSWQPSKPRAENAAESRSDDTPSWPPHPEGFPATGELPPWVTR